MLCSQGSREPKAGPPDYDVWRQKCEKLLGEIGGLGSGYELHTWTDLLPKAAGEAPPAEKPKVVTPAVPSTATE